MTDHSRSAYMSEVNRAADVVSVQADCHIEQALRLMHDRAVVSRVTLSAIAVAVLDGSIRFDA